MWDGAQHEFCMDERDLLEYYKHPKFENVVHLRTTTVKLIVYSTGDSAINVSQAHLWDPWYVTDKRDVRPSVRDYEMKVKKGMNVLCFCQQRSGDTYHFDYERTSVESRGDSRMMLHPTPDLHSTWQSVVLTDKAPLSLADMSCIAIGFHYLRREDDAKEWEDADPWVKRIHEHRASELDQFRLTWPQKILLMYNTTGTKNKSCCDQYHDDVGHYDNALSGSSEDRWEWVFNFTFIAEHKDRYQWYQQQWFHMLDSLYWKSVTTSHEIYDFVFVTRRNEIVPRTCDEW